MNGNEFVFRYNRRGNPEAASQTLLGPCSLVLLDHAWNRGSARPVAISGPEQRGTAGVLPAWLFEALERGHLTGRVAHSLARRYGFRKTCDIPSRPYWNVGERDDEQGCPTVSPLAGGPNAGVRPDDGVG